MAAEKLDCQYLDVTAFTNFISFATTSKIISAILCNRHVKQTKSTMGTETNQTNHILWPSKLIRNLILCGAVQ